MEWCHHDTSRLLPNHVGCMLIQSAYNVKPCLETPPSNTYRSICVFYQNHKHIMRVKIFVWCKQWKLSGADLGRLFAHLLAIQSKGFSTSLQARMPDMYMGIILFNLLVQLSLMLTLIVGGFYGVEINGVILSRALTDPWISIGYMMSKPRAASLEYGMESWMYTITANSRRWNSVYARLSSNLLTVVSVHLREFSYVRLVATKVVRDLAVTKNQGAQTKTKVKRLRLSTNFCHHILSKMTFRNCSLAKPDTCFL